MTERGLVYRVEDRSIILPFYKRFIVEPSLRFIPATVNPNTITHAGHLLNLAAATILIATWPRPSSSRWPYIVAAILLHLYNWCDNADGAHARRTKQTSALGEFLDHGLDMLNTVYIAILSAMGVGSPAFAWLVILLVLPSAAACTYWEQAETGTFHLGRVNQIESVFMLSIILIVAGIFGSDVWQKVQLGPITLQHAIMMFVLGLCSFQQVQAMWRVSRERGFRKVMPVLPLYLFDATLALATIMGAMSPLAAAIVGTLGNVFFGLRMLATRLSEEKPVLEYTMPAASALLLGLIAWRALGRPVGVVSDVSVASALGVLFTVLAIVYARIGVRRVVLLDRARGAAS